MISTRDLSGLPDIDDLRRILQSMASLDAILEPEWQFRYYSFDARWNDGEHMASMRNGQGDDFFAHFSAAGCWIKGFAHESPMTPWRRDGTVAVWPGVLDAVPAEFAQCVAEPAFSVGNSTTFCVWRRYGEPAWSSGAIAYPPEHRDPDGSQMLLSILDGDPESYRLWADDYYERPIDPAAVEWVYRHRPITREWLAALNPDLDLADLDAELATIGYPDCNFPTS